MTNLYSAQNHDGEYFSKAEFQSRGNNATSDIKICCGISFYQFSSFILLNELYLRFDRLIINLDQNRLKTWCNAHKLTVPIRC
jgi:hypothetical protein